MAMLELEVSPRQILGKRVKALRRQKIIPANIYGPGIPSQAVQVALADLLPILRQAGPDTVIHLRVAGEDKVRPVLIRQVQRDPITDAILHLDLYQLPEEGASKGD